MQKKLIYLYKQGELIVNDSEQLWRDLFGISENMKLIYSDSRNFSMFYQVTVSQLKMVRTVYELTCAAGSGVALKSVAQKLGTTAAAASEMVDVLVRKKILERKQDPDDRRQVRIQLIPELFSHFKHIEEHFSDITAEFTATLSPEEQAFFKSCSARFNAFVSSRAAELGK